MANDTTIELLEMHKHELELIRQLRKIGFGEVTIIMRNRLPVKLKRTVEFTDIA